MPIPRSIGEIVPIATSHCSRFVLSKRPTATSMGSRPFWDIPLIRQACWAIRTALGAPFPAGRQFRARNGLLSGRQWHLFFAWVFAINGLIFTAYAVSSRHLTRDLTLTRTDVGEIGTALKDHICLRHPKDETRRYNVLQKLAYLGVIFGLAPVIVLTGLTMSPTIDAALPGLLTFFGGRQAARTIHFVACFSFVAFILIHVSQVILTGFFKNIRSMVTGWLVIHHEGVRHDA